MQNISLAQAGVRTALLMLQAMQHLKDWEFFIICYGMQPAELLRSPVFTDDPSHATDEGLCMDVMLQRGLLSQSPLGSH